MVRTLTTSQTATSADLQPLSKTTDHDKSRARSRAILSHAILCIGSFLVYLLLNRPEVLLLSSLGMIVWYPAIGLGFALMLAISPRYMPLFAVAGAVAGMLFYRQPFYSWGTLVAIPIGSSLYAVGAYLLRVPLRIDCSLGQRRDVMRYVLITSMTAILAALTGAVCLLADHTIKGDQFWSSGLSWYFGDMIGLLSVAPFLLIHVLPWVCKRTLSSGSDTTWRGSEAEREVFGTTTPQILEFTGQAAALVLLFWIMFGGPAPRQLFYLAFLPVIWIAMRQGIRGAVSALLALNFGIVASIRFMSVSAEIVTKLSLLMLATSATGLIVGSAVSERRRIANELRERTIFLNSLIENSPFGIVVLDRRGTIQLFNQAFANLFLYNAAEIIGQDLKNLIVPAGLRVEYDQFATQIGAGDPVHRTVRRLRKDGELVDVETHALPLVQDGQIQGGYVIYKDISEQVRADVMAKQHADATGHWVAELELRTLQISLLNEIGSLLQCANSSEEAYAVIGKSAKQLFARAGSGALYIRKPVHDVLELAASWGASRIREAVFASHSCLSVRTGQAYWSESPSRSIVCAHIDNAITSDYLCVPMLAHGEILGVLHLQCDPDHGGDTEADQKSRDSLKRLAVLAASQIGLSLANLHLTEELRDQSIRDPLTGLFNRRFMQESLNKELQRSRRKQRSLAVIFLDLDHFKHFNDTFGHDAGDSVLKSMADMFRVHFRTDDVICRYGGEEFAVILPESSIEDAAKRAETLRLATRDLRLVHGGILLSTVTLSIGIAGFPDHGKDAHELLDQADKCLYQSKANGRDRVTIAGAPNSQAILA